MILICYDGSADAKAAIERGIEFVHGEPVTVLTVWQPFLEVLEHAPSGFGLTAGMVDAEEVDKVTREAAMARAEEGAELARQAGVQAEARIRSQQTTTAGAILSEAAELGAHAILMGSRGLTGLKSLLLGSVSHAVMQHADRPVIVIPSPDVAAARDAERQARG